MMPGDGGKEEWFSVMQWEHGGHELSTWYRVVGDLSAPRLPVVTLHGGPGAAHDYLVAMAALAEDGRAVVFYDQVGNGRSTHRPDLGADFWTVELFKRELALLLDHLGIADRHAVIGQSWGGFLAQEHALTRPPGLRAMVLADTAASFPDFVAECNRLRAELPPEVEATLRRHEADGTTDAPEYAAACDVFYRRHVCRLDPWPAELDEGFAWIERDPTVYYTMNGPSEFHVIGSIKDWSVADRLSEIDVPTLLVSGRYDEATPALQQTLLDGIAGSEWVMFEYSAHCPHAEEPERFAEVVGAFLRQHD
jgi:L-proline amide hydrolase